MRGNLQYGVSETGLEDLTLLERVNRPNTSMMTVFGLLASQMTSQSMFLRTSQTVDHDLKTIKMKQKDYTPDELSLIGVGFDEALDKVCDQLSKQTVAIKGISGNAIPRSGVVEMFEHLIRSFKGAKGNPAQQVFTIEEVRAVVDHLTGKVMPTNKSTMQYFDENVFPRLIAGDIHLESFTQPKPKNDGGDETNP